MGTGEALISTLNGKEFGHPNAATDLTFDFGQLIAHAARTRHLEAGTVVGSGRPGTVTYKVAGACAEPPIDSVFAPAWPQNANPVASP